MRMQEVIFVSLTRSVPETLRLRSPLSCSKFSLSRAGSLGRALAGHMRSFSLVELMMHLDMSLR